MSKSVTVVWDDSLAEHEADLTDIDLADLVSRLDGRERTLVTIVSDVGSAACGGDSRTGLVMYASFEGERFYQLVRPDSDRDDEMWVVAGGQAGLYAARFVVSAEMATMAMARFAGQGDLLPAATWEAS